MRTQADIDFQNGLILALAVDGYQKAQIVENPIDEILINPVPVNVTLSALPTTLKFIATMPEPKVFRGVTDWTFCTLTAKSEITMPYDIIYGTTADRKGVILIFVSLDENNLLKDIDYIKTSDYPNYYREGGGFGFNGEDNIPNYCVVADNGQSILCAGYSDGKGNGATQTGYTAGYTNSDVSITTLGNSYKYLIYVGSFGYEEDYLLVNRRVILDEDKGFKHVISNTNVTTTMSYSGTTFECEYGNGHDASDIENIAKSLMPYAEAYYNKYATKKEDTNG